jgi:pimeloyl-ACP methyl ester carboxylesterase
VEYVVATAEAYAGGSPHFTQEEVRALVERDVARTRSMASTLTNHYAMGFDGPEHGGFGDIAVPALVIQGELDPIFPLAHGRALRDAIPRATLLVLPETGHEVPAGVWDVFVPALLTHTAGVR